MTESLDRKSSPSCGAEGRRHLRGVPASKHRIHRRSKSSDRPVRGRFTLTHACTASCRPPQRSKSEGTGLYASSLTTPAERVKLPTTGNKAVYASGAERRDIFCGCAGATLVAQELDPRALRPVGEPQVIVEGLNGTSESDIHVAASATGPPLSSPRGEQFTLAGGELPQLRKPLNGSLFPSLKR
jgi:hypothetical protein